MDTDVLLLFGAAFAATCLFLSKSGHLDLPPYPRQYAVVDRSFAVVSERSQQDIYRRAIEIGACKPELSPVDWVTLGAHYSVSGQPAYAYHAFYMAQLESSGVVDRATAASIVGQINERRVLADE